MKIVFLDCDGVIALRQTAGWSLKNFLNRKNRAEYVINAEAIARLNQIAEETSALFVLTSSWEITEDVRPILHSVGFLGTFHKDWAVDGQGECRDDEIARWLDAHPDTTDHINIYGYNQFQIDEYMRLVRVDIYGFFQQDEFDWHLSMLKGSFHKKSAMGALRTAMFV